MLVIIFMNIPEQNLTVTAFLLAHRRLDGTLFPPQLAWHSVDHHHSSGLMCYLGSAPGCSQRPKEGGCGLPSGCHDRGPGQAATLTPLFTSLGQGWYLS